MITGNEKVEAEFDFDPRCIQVSDEGWVAAGGVDDNGGSPAASNSNRGRFSLHNPVTGEQHTRMLGELINNAVILYKEPSSSHTNRVLVCNNDWGLYFLEIDNSRVEPLTYMKLKAPLNHAAISPDNKTVLACGDSSDVFLLNPSSDNTGWNVTKTIKTDSDYGFSVAFHPTGMSFGVASQNGNCLLFDMRNTSKPVTCIRSSRFGTQLGAFRCLKFSQGSEDLLFLSEQVERVHVVDLRDVDEHQILSIPPVFSDQETTNSNRQPPSESQLRPSASRHASAIRGLLSLNSDDGPDTCLPSMSELDSNLPPYRHDDMMNGTYRQISTPQDTVVRDYVSYVAGGVSDSSVPATSLLRGFVRGSDEHFRQSPLSRSSVYRYNTSDFGISGLAWSNLHGGTLVVGSDNGLAMWNIDEWARRTFPTYTIR